MISKSCPQPGGTLMIPIYLHFPSRRAAPVSLSRDASPLHLPLPQQNHGMKTIQLLLSIPAESLKNLLQPSQLQVSQGGQEEGSEKKSFQTVPTGRAGASERGDALAGAERGVQGMTQVGHGASHSLQEQSAEGRSLMHFLLPQGLWRCLLHLVL